MKFIGRKKELESLEILLKKKSASLVVIRGRRRVGKSRLMKEFASDKKSWIFSGLPPRGTIQKQSERIGNLARRLPQNFDTERATIALG